MEPERRSIGGLKQAPLLAGPADEQLLSVTRSKKVVISGEAPINTDASANRFAEAPLPVGNHLLASDAAGAR